MHRHSYKGRKFGRERDQRKALIKSLAESLVHYETIETTLPKAKEVVSYTEKLITKAKKGDLHNRRQIIAALSTYESAAKLVDDIAPKLGKRNSGYFRIAKTRTRRGDNAQMAKVSFVDNLAGKTVAKATTKPTPKSKTSTKKPVDKSADEGSKEPVKKVSTDAKTRSTGASAQAARRTGRRGNR